MTVEDIASAIRNNISNGLKGLTNISYSLEQIVEEVYLERNALIKEYMLQRVIPLEQLSHSLSVATTINKNIDKCNGIKSLHFEIPKLSNIINNPVLYIGTEDRSCPYKIYYDYTWIYHKYNRAIVNKPYVWVDTALNCNGKFDVFLFNLPLIKQVAVVAIWEDLREICKDGCNTNVNMPDFMKKDIIQRITERYVKYYRQLNQPIIYNNTQVSSS